MESIRKQIVCKVNFGLGLAYFSQNRSKVNRLRCPALLMVKVFLPTIYLSTMRSEDIFRLYPPTFHFDRFFRLYHPTIIRAASHSTAVDYHSSLTVQVRETKAKKANRRIQKKPSKRKQRNQ